jgi:hypothetical protein
MIGAPGGTAVKRSSSASSAASTTPGLSGSSYRTALGAFLGLAGPLQQLQAKQRFRRVEQPMKEEVCAENNQHLFDYHMPLANKSDFWAAGATLARSFANDLHWNGERSPLQM